MPQPRRSPTEIAMMAVAALIALGVLYLIFLK
jgi:predicted nucleic acid-binding Zn ribbon protein